MGHLKSLIKSVPVLGPALIGLRGHGIPFTTSGAYWDRRYRSGGTSGSGSYNRLARFKADFLNQFVADYQIRTVIEFGSGDGAQLALARYPDYVGIDVAPSCVAMCRELFSTDASKRFFVTTATPPGLQAELSLSLDVIYHLVEDEIFDTYMHDLFAAATRFVVIFSSNMERAWRAKHVRHRRFTDWVDRNEPSWSLVSVTPNAYPYNPAKAEITSFADFHIFAPRATCE